MKDFYDLWVIASTHDMDGAWMGKAIKATFTQRETVLSVQTLSVFEIDFTNDESKQRQWAAFLSKNSLESNTSFKALMMQLQHFLEPAYLAAASGITFDGTWSSQDWEWRH